MLTYAGYLCVGSTSEMELILHEKINQRIKNKIFSFETLFSNKSLNILRARMHLATT